MAQYIYIIETIGKSPKFIKIGIAANPATRLSALQIACPLPLRLAASYANRNISARQVERLFHNILKPYRVSGEWFSLSAVAALQLIATNNLTTKKPWPRKKSIDFKQLRLLRQKRHRLSNDFNSLIGKRVNWLDRYLAERSLNH